jgi:3-methyladenine DNA glycosylase/8-oxoguanine DNA glycosylase
MDFEIPLPAGYDPAPTLQFLGRDPQSSSEWVRGDGFLKTVRLGEGQPGRLTVAIAGGAARCRVEAPETMPPGSLEEAAAIVRRLLGLEGTDPARFIERLRDIPGHGDLRRLAAGREELRIPLTADLFEGLAWAIIGQQINLAFATVLRRRLIEGWGEVAGEGYRVFPSPDVLATLDPADLLPLQFSRRKAEYLIGVSRAVTSGALPLAGMASETAPQVESRLLALRGIGPWSAQYVLLRAWGFADCVPAGDSALSTALARFFALDHRPGPDEVRSLLAPFAPFRSLATCHFWASLGDPS